MHATRSEQTLQVLTLGSSLLDQLPHKDVVSLLRSAQQWKAACCHEIENGQITFPSPGDIAYKKDSG